MTNGFRKFLLCFYIHQVTFQNWPTCQPLYVTSKGHVPKIYNFQKCLKLFLQHFELIHCVIVCWRRLNSSNIFTRNYVFSQVYCASIGSVTSVSFQLLERQYKSFGIVALSTGTWYLLPTSFLFLFMPFCKHEFKADCKNQTCSFQFGWPTGNWTSYLCCIIALVFPLMLDRITRGTEIVWFYQCEWGCGNCLFWGLYLMPSLGCSKCTKTSGCLWSRLASCCPKKNK